jgi:Yip1 domain
MDIVTRAKNICLTPGSELMVIAGETTPAGGMITGYVIPLAAIGAIAGFIGGSLIGYTLPFIGSYRVPVIAGTAAAVFTVVMSVVACFVVSLIINALAPTFGAEKNSAQALKVAVYSYTPAWVAGVFRIFPLLGILALLGALYGLYLLYLGLPRLMKCPQEKAAGYTVVVVIAAIVVSVVTTAVAGIFVGAGMLSTGALSSLTPQASRNSNVEFDKDSALGRLQRLGEKLDESNKKAEAAEKRGDKNAQVAAAVEGFTTLLGGGRHIDPIDIDRLKSFVPESFAGLKRTSTSADKSGLAGVIASKAEATYSDGSQKRVKLEVVDSGGASGLLALAGWATLQGESDNADSSERTHKDGDRVIHEKASKHAGGTNEVAILVGNRFLVTASGEGVDVSGLKSALSTVDLAKLESMKDVGVSQ